MGLSTALVGVLPTFASIGWVAPIILFCCGSPKDWHWAANMGVPRPTLRNMHRTENAASLPAGFKPRPRWVYFSHWPSFGSAGILLSADDFKVLGLAYPVPAFSNPSPGDLHLHPVEASGIASLP